MAGQTGHRARPSLAGRRGKLARGPTQHNGLLHVARPVAALKLRLVATLHATPVMSCAHLPCACGQLLTACSNTPHAQQPLVCAVTAGAVTAECSGQARAAQLHVLAPAHPVGLALARTGRAGVARPPPTPDGGAYGTGVPCHRRRWGAAVCGVFASGGACVGVQRSRLACASPRTL